MATGKEPAIIAVFGVVVTMLKLAATSTTVALLAVVLRRFYHRVVWGPARHRRHEPTPQPHDEQSDSLGIRAADVAPSTYPERADAAATTRDAQLAHAIAGLVYAAIAAGVLLAYAHLSVLENAVVAAYASLAPALLILMWSMRLSLLRRLYVLLIYAALGVVITSIVVMGNPFRSLFGSAAFVLLPICLLAPLFVRSIEPFVSFLLPLVILVFAVGMLIDQTQPATTREALKTIAANPVVVLVGLAVIVAGFYLSRLLLLRVFGGPDERQDLLDDLRDTWRRIGAIDLLGGSDLAVATLQPGMLQAFLLRVTDEQFVRKEEDIEGRLAQRYFTIGADARYPVNAIYCSADSEIWKSVFVRLEKGVDAVLMDVRGFTAANEGIQWELDTLVQHTELHRIVLLSDESTRSEALEEVLAGREVTTLRFERRSDRERWALFDLLLNAAYASSGAKAGIS